MVVFAVLFFVVLFLALSNEKVLVLREVLLRRRPLGGPQVLVCPRRDNARGVREDAGGLEKLNSNKPEIVKHSSMLGMTFGACMVSCLADVQLLACQGLEGWEFLSLLGTRLGEDFFKTENIYSVMVH